MGPLFELSSTGRLDIKGIMCSVRKSDLEKTKLQQCEWTVKDWEEQSKKLGKRVDGLTVIFDMEGVGTKMLWRPGMQMYLHLVKILEDNYPEMMKRLCVINARPLISEDMKNKIHVLGGDFKSTLLKFVDKEELPAFLGGMQTDPDGNPRCITKICQGGDVPEQYYLENTELLDHMQTVTVGRGDKVQIEQIVEKSGSILRWEFKTEDYDIGFSLLMKKNGENVPVIPMVRVNSHVVAQDGNVLCFDNSFSWTRTKKIYYSCEVLSSDETELKSEINDLIENGDWETLANNFETTHL
ncbi:hypothetical protein KUTeg_009696 [Tegillarca granosa]|uniref:CRAL-TRIO domain-containing protein n=1 Tax=Tegillarca granosa TaxID=220873 RepID=A0ABQ9F4M8_TEGGR|nr:hypothetical protein KUTeg_009696 [Tegillarca granosa]